MGVCWVHRIRAEVEIQAVVAVVPNSHEGFESLWWWCRCISWRMVRWWLKRFRSETRMKRLLANGWKTWEHARMLPKLSPDPILSSVFITEVVFLSRWLSHNFSGQWPISFSLPGASAVTCPIILLAWSDIYVLRNQDHLLARSSISPSLQYVSPSSLHVSPFSLHVSPLLFTLALFSSH